LFAFASPPSNQINYCVGEKQNNSLDETEIPVSDFIISALSEHGKIQIEWTHALPLTTRVRAYVMSSIEKYSDRISRSFLPWYKNGKGPYDLDAENYTVEDKTQTLTKEEVESFTQRVGSAVLVTTAYRTGLNMRLIVDGSKRSCAIQNKINNGHKFPPVTVIECYGPDVANSFPTDFSHIIRRFIRK
jgi:hypothetical protein